MQIYLVQHGISKPKDEDPERSLSSAGEADVRRIAETARNYSIPLRGIIHSGKKRAQQTAEIMAEALQPPQDIQVGEELGPVDDILVWAPKCPDLDQYMLVGHLPFLERLTNQLVAQNPDNRVIKFQNAGIVCLELEEQKWHIKWALMPQIK